MEVIIILIVIAGGSWLVFSIFGSLTRTRPVSRFGMPLGNPEVIDTLVLKAYKKLKGPKKYTIEEVQKISELVKDISTFENGLKMFEKKYKEGEITEYDYRFQKQEIESAIRFTKIQLSSIIND